MQAAIYPGSFDPLTFGHLDIIERARARFDRVVVAVADNPQKHHLFSVQERMDLVRKCLPAGKDIEVDSFKGLLVDYARKKGINTLLRGLRAVSDFEYEFNLATMNRKIAKEVETVFLMTGESSFYVSSKLVREVASFGADVSAMVPEPVSAALKKKFGI